MDPIRQQGSVCVYPQSRATLGADGCWASGVRRAHLQASLRAPLSVVRGHGCHLASDGRLYSACPTGRGGRGRSSHVGRRSGRCLLGNRHCVLGAARTSRDAVVPRLVQWHNTCSVRDGRRPLWVPCARDVGRYLARDWACWLGRRGHQNRLTSHRPECRRGPQHSSPRSPESLRGTDCSHSVLKIEHRVIDP